MIRTATLLPALILAFGLASTSLAMAAGSASSKGNHANVTSQGNPAQGTDDECDVHSKCPRQ